MKNPIIEVKDLEYTYGNGKTALNKINVNFYKGERVCVIGSNGAGKSTFFLNLNGVLKAKNGKILYNGQVIEKKNLNELRKNVGIVFQDADSQIIASTVMAEVSFGPMNLKLPKEEVKSRVEMALNYMNISDFKDRPPHYLSGGEKKRVSIADIIAMKPEVIIFDEPTASLDPINSAVLEEVFSKGNIIFDGTPTEIFKNEDVVKAANLKKPILFDMYEVLVSKNIVSNDNIYPKSIDEFKTLLK